MSHYYKLSLLERLGKEKAEETMRNTLDYLMFHVPDEKLSDRLAGAVRGYTYSVVIYAGDVYDKMSSDILKKHENLMTGWMIFNFTLSIGMALVLGYAYVIITK